MKQNYLGLENREKVIICLFLFITICLIYRLYFINTKDKDFLIQRQNSFVVRNISLKSIRGNIVDSSFKNIAVSTPMYSIYLNFSEFQKEKDKEKLLILINKLNLKLNLKNINKNIYLKKDISPNDLKIIHKFLTIKGIYTYEYYKRYYPYSNYLSNIIGYTDFDENGIDGIEYSLNKKLKGKDGLKTIQIDLKKNIIEQKIVENPHNGTNIQLTINSDFQQIAFNDLKNQIKVFNADSGSVIILNAQNGDILSMVSYPSFNPNLINLKEVKTGNNKSIQNIFDPGSIMKPLVIAKALNDKKVSENTIINTSQYRVGNKIIKDDHSFNAMSVRDIIVHSSDIGTSKIALKYSPYELWSYYSSLGFGKKNDISLNGETKGILLNYKKWTPTDQALMSFGYGISINLLQIARSYTLFTNNGCLLSVNILKDNNKNNYCQKIIDNKTANMVKNILIDTVQDGTGKLASVDGMTVAGKTGTAQKLVNGKYSSKEHIASFVGFAPANNPKYIIAIMIDNPRKGYYGGKVSAPLFSKILNDINKLNKEYN